MRISVSTTRCLSGFPTWLCISELRQCKKKKKKKETVSVSSNPKEHWSSLLFKGWQIWGQTIVQLSWLKCRKSLMRSSHLEGVCSTDDSSEIISIHTATHSMHWGCRSRVEITCTHTPTLTPPLLPLSPLQGDEKPLWVWHVKSQAPGLTLTGKALPNSKEGKVTWSEM